MGSKEKPNIQRIEKMVINEKPMQEAKYEEYSKSLINVLDKITPKDLSEAKQKIEQAIEHNEEFNKGADFFRLSSLQKMLGKLESLKSRQNKTSVIDMLAKRDLYELDDAAQAVGLIGNQDIEQAVDNLNIAAFNRAQSAFPEDLERQNKDREAANEEKITRQREELMKKSVR